MYKSPGTETQLAWGNAEQAAQLHHYPIKVLMEPDSRNSLKITVYPTRGDARQLSGPEEMTYATRPTCVAGDHSETVSERVVVRACDGESDEVSEEYSKEKSEEESEEE